MSFTMKMLAVSVLVVAMMALTRGAAPVTEPPLPENEDMEPVYKSTPDEEADEPGSRSEEEEEESNSATEEGNHKIAKRATLCPCGWSLSGGRCFRYFSVAKTWAEAQRHCQKMGGNLASVHNRNEENWLKRLAGSKAAWLGLSDAQQEHYWFWINGGRLTYKNWCGGQPDNAGRQQHCLQFNWSGGRCWDDDNCLVRKGYICRH
ncbi:galactose-specific lectin nattectin-like [Symphorus nematophorus]